MLRTTACAVLLMLVTTSGAAADATGAGVSFSSGVQRVPLVELFTSEGCSSCPPADRWLSELKTDPGLFRTFTPIGFHVDYWDYLGWKDRFAQAEYGTRQRRLAAGRSVVYTPGVFRNGFEWRGWSAGMPAAHDGVKVGELSATVNGDGIKVQFDAADPQSDALTAHVAVLGMNLETRVRAGENDGRALRHDFVALGLTHAPLDRDGRTFRTTATLPDTGKHPGARAVIVWVTTNSDPAPLQSAGRLLPAKWP